jgi:hypothetical protein
MKKKNEMGPGDLRKTRSQKVLEIPVEKKAWSVNDDPVERDG